MDLERMAFNIKYYREQNGWTQLQLSEHLMTSRSVIAKWESTLAKPDIQSLVLMSDLFSVSLDQIVGHVPLRKDILRDFNPSYQSRMPFDLDTFNLAYHLSIHPDLKDHLTRIKDLPFKKQRSLLVILDAAISELNTYPS